MKNHNCRRNKVKLMINSPCLRAGPDPLSHNLPRQSPREPPTINLTEALNALYIVRLLDDACGRPRFISEGAIRRNFNHTFHSIRYMNA